MAEHLTKKDAVVVALASLGGATSAVDTEDVAIAAHRLAPVAFGWRKHTEHIDLDTVRTSLRHEAESREARIGGSIRTGWHLTPAGQAWLAFRPALQGQKSITVADLPAATAKRRAETREVSTAIDRIRSSAAFKQWINGHEFSDRAAAAVFRIDEYTPALERSRKTSRINVLASGDDEVAAFLKVAIPTALALRAPAAAQTQQQKDER
ncbi:hypothetical protein CELL_01609 [Cellulomonas sp. T2.31MG-18]|uniref:hypothetical protein n=1 Tax=Cellulomonas sp. T2.31MG-18 TaxID=3157619 RepID=UPI0035E78930